MPYFVGMHALQLIPFTALMLELGTRRIPLLRAAATRLGLLWILVSSYLGALALQALAGQSVVRPAASVTMWGVTLIAAAAGLAVVVLTRGRRAVITERPAG